MVVTFAEVQDTAIELGLCFCMCGHYAEDTPPGNLFGKTIPGVCTDCRGRKGHERIATPAMYDAVVNPYVEDEVSTPARAERVVTPEQRERAITYVKSVADEPPTLEIASLAEKVESGADLTARQVEVALAAEAVEARHGKRQHERLVKDHYRRGSETDLTRLTIPETVKDGRYAVEADTGDVVLVEVSRQYDGALRGATVVTINVGDERWYGVQRAPLPGFLGRMAPPHYKGWFPQLIADLVADPQIARDMYEDMTYG